jgi:hypothetical protein
MTVPGTHQKTGAKHRRKEYRASVRRQYRADRRAGREERPLEEARANTEQFFWYCPNSPLVPKVQAVVRKPASKPSRWVMVAVLALAACVAAAIWRGA